MPDIDTVCNATATALAAVTPALRAIGYIDDDVHPPQAQVFTRDHDPRFVFGSNVRVFPLGVRVIVKRSNARSAQKSLRGFMEPAGGGSVRAALEDDGNWPDGVHSVEVVNIGQPFEMETTNEIYMAVDFDVDVTW